MSNDRYAHEVSSPKIPLCGRSKFKLIFNGSTLEGVWSKKKIFYKAVSGSPNRNGTFDYSLDRQKMSSIGPIPEGMYWIDPRELQENSIWRYKNSIDSWGNYWITIHAFPETERYDRGGFFIHGGSREGSAGCIDLTSDMNKFVAQLKSEIDKFNCYIPLEVKYT